MVMGMEIQQGLLYQRAHKLDMSQTTRTATTATPMPFLDLPTAAPSIAGMETLITTVAAQTHTADRHDTPHNGSQDGTVSP